MTNNINSHQVETGNDWSKEFPIIRIVKKRGILFFLDILQAVEKLIRKLVTRGTLFLMGYLIVTYFVSIYNNKQISPFWTHSGLFSVDIWITYRNLLLMFLSLDLPLLVASCVIEAKRDNIARVAKMSIAWLTTVLFVIFSYAIAALVADFALAVFYINWSLLKQNGVPVGEMSFEWLFR